MLVQFHWAIFNLSILFCPFHSSFQNCSQNSLYEIVFPWLGGRLCGVTFSLVLFSMRRVFGMIYSFTPNLLTDRHAAMTRIIVNLPHTCALQDGRKFSWLTISSVLLQDNMYRIVSCTNVLWILIFWVTHATSICCGSSYSITESVIIPALIETLDFSSLSNWCYIRC